MDDLLKLRQLLLRKTTVVDPPKTRGDLYQFLGNTKEERVVNLVKKILGENISENRKKIFQYIIEFWERSTIEVPYKAPGFKGVNLAKRPFLAPTGSNDGDTFAFGEQYRWDTFFQNRGLILAGGIDLARDQLLNLTDVYDEFKRIPNALVSPFLSRPQPPFEMRMVMDLLEGGLPHDGQIPGIVRVIEEELVTEWFDYRSGKQNHRQSEEMIKKYGMLTRYEPHSNPFMVGCEDGKDHNWIIATYSYEFLPVQLNAILYGTLTSLQQYYSSLTWGNNTEKAALYDSLSKQMLADFQKTFWCTTEKWTGFRDYSLLKGKEGHILYGDLSAEIFPLFFKLATPDQAEKTKNNLATYYKGDIGLSSTSLELRNGGSIPQEPVGPWKFQWEYPNCWPPLMMIAVEGLKNYG
ncbi:MAG: trehalase family glycosidase, partial [Patescibacteria group bacterium]